MRDLLGSHTRSAFIAEQLSAYSGQKMVLANSIMVCCPFHGDKDPSGRIYNASGFFACYGCGKTAKWDEVALALGLKPWKKPKPSDVFAEDIKLPSFDETPVEDETRGELRITGDLPPDRRWRSISTNLLISIGAKRCRVYYTESDYLTEEFIYLPCKARGKEVGFIRARKRKVKDKPSYLNSSGQWSLTHGLFPLDYAVSMMKRLGLRVLVLVEGPRDALRLLSYGIPAVAILGTRSWSDKKTRLLALSGVDTVVLFMDGDAPGADAAKMIREAIDMQLHVKRYKIKHEKAEDWDPGNCPEEYILELKRRLRIEDSGTNRPDGSWKRHVG